MPSNVRVAVRIRPLLPNERSAGHKQSFIEVDSVNNQISIQQEDSNSATIKKTYRFDKIIDPNCPQKEVFDSLQIRGLVQKVLDGFHATVFAYGQTGSGKTYTMEGYKYEEAKQNERAGKPIIQEDDDNGVTVRSIREAFSQADKMKSEKHVTISCSFLQIYNEKIFDLLNAQTIKKANEITQQGLRIRWNKNDQFTVENMYVFKCDSADHALQLYNKGIKNKIVASHKMNNASSRSHCIFTLNVEIVDIAQVDNIVTSKLQLVDLAGSERSNMTGNTGLAQKESIDINKSLFTMRQVITGLAEGFKNKKAVQQHIPYRDSKLTCLLKQSLGGNSYCLMIACLSPSDAYIDENISTLNYATKASFISNEPIKNEDPKIKLINELKQKVAALQKELAQANNHIEFLTSLTGGEAPQLSQSVMIPQNQIQQMIDQTPLVQPNEQEIGPSQPKVEIIPKQLQQQKPKAKALQPQIAENAFHRLDHETLSQKLIESVAMVKEFMQSNKQYRETIEQLNLENERKETELYQFQVENRDLRDRIEILESVIGVSTTTNDFDALDWRELIKEDSKGPAVKSSNLAINEMATELIETKKANRQLEEEVIQLRLQLQQSDDSQYFQYGQDPYQEFQYQQPSHKAQSFVQPQPAKKSPYKQSVPSSQGPKNKQEALKLLNEMMNKRVVSKQSGLRK